MDKKEDVEKLRKKKPPIKAPDNLEAVYNEHGGFIGRKPIDRITENQLGMFINYIEIWEKIIIGENKSWVLFENGTCVILMEPQENLEAQAKNLLKEYGPVFPGTSAGDFNVIKLTDHPGWVVTGHHKDILNYVSPGEIDEHNINDVAIGLLGRHKRDQDSKIMKVIFTEDKR